MLQCWKCKGKLNTAVQYNLDTYTSVSTLRVSVGDADHIRHLPQSYTKLFDSGDSKQMFVCPFCGAILAGDKEDLMNKIRRTE
jgi:hypothetical protein